MRRPTIAAIGWRAGRRTREAAILYASLGILALWVSFGPGGGLYSLFYSMIPGFTFMRAPSRFGRSNRPLMGRISHGRLCRNAGACIKKRHDGAVWE